MKPNPNQLLVDHDYLFAEVRRRITEYESAHPDERVLRLGVGDISRPLCPAAVTALCRAAEEMGCPESVKGYQPESGAPFLREAIAGDYRRKGVSLSPEEIFVTDGALPAIGWLFNLFAPGSRVLLTDPVYPAYRDNCVLSGMVPVSLAAGPENDYLPVPDGATQADIAIVCSPNNPTGAVYNKAQLQKWVDWANRTDALLLFDGAYEAFIDDPELPHSIYEIPGSETCAVEIRSFSKTAGFTGLRCGYTVLPLALEREGACLNALWAKDRTIRTNGVSYPVQRAAEAVLTPEGIRRTREDIAVYKQNLRVLTDALDRVGIRYCGGANAPYVFLRCPMGMSGWAFFDWLLDTCRIAGTPGEGFGANGAGCFRFTAFGSPEDTEEAARRLTEALRKNP